MKEDTEDAAPVDCFAAIDGNKISFLADDLGREIFLHAGKPWAQIEWEAYRPQPGAKGMFQGGLNITDGNPAVMREQLAHLQRVAGDIGLNLIDIS